MGCVVTAFLKSLPPLNCFLLPIIIASLGMDVEKSEQCRPDPVLMLNIHAAAANDEV